MIAITHSTGVMICNMLQQLLHQLLQTGQQVDRS